jgi:hypothetical protein
MGPEFPMVLTRAQKKLLVSRGRSLSESALNFEEYEEPTLIVASSEDPELVNAKDLRSDEMSSKFEQRITNVTQVERSPLEDFTTNAIVRPTTQPKILSSNEPVRPTWLVPNQNTNEIKISPEETTFDADVHVGDLYKYTKELKEYSQTSHDDFKSFEVKISSLLAKLAIASNANTTVTLNGILSRNIRLSKRTEDLMLIIFNDYLVGTPSEDTRSIRESNVWQERTLRIWNQLRTAYPDDLGKSYLLQFRKLKYDPSTSILTYNQIYRSLFEKCRRFGRTMDGQAGVDDYLNSLPTQNSTMQMINIDFATHRAGREVLVEETMTFLASIIQTTFDCD